MNDQHITALIKPTDDAHMGILWVKNEVAGDGLAPGNIGAVAMLHPCAASMSNHISAIADIVENPVHEAGAIQAVGPYRAAAGTAGGGDLPGRSPAGIPAEDETLATPEVVDLAEQLIGRENYLLALCTETGWQVVYNLLDLLWSQGNISKIACQLLKNSWYAGDSISSSNLR